MHNLFDFATKELSQDAFLRWLFENYDDPVVGKASHNFTELFCPLQKDEYITSVKTFAQLKKIDITVQIETSLGRKIKLFIEDKTFSNEHNQLSVYDKFIDDINDYEVYKIFYKTNLIDEEEQKRVQNVNDTNKTDWKIYDIYRIYGFFSKYISSDNLILSQYSEYITQIYKAITNTKKPQDNQTNLHFLQWQAYFRNVVIPALKGNGISYQCSTWKAGQFPYVVLYIKKSGYGDRKIPYLEIQSRDCLNNDFIARILCHEIDPADINQQNVLIKNIMSHPQLECKGLRKNPRQVGTSRKGLKANTDEQFIGLVEKHISYYMQVMKDWN